MPKSKSNLGSPNAIQRRIQCRSLRQWFRHENERVPDAFLRRVLQEMIENLDAIVKWPERALLVWMGCVRGKEHHVYPAWLKLRARELRLRTDARFNGPAILAYQIAGGERPPRFGSNNCWSIHHLYNGKFPYIGRTDSLHATKDSRHFTQSAGLVAVHPLADQACDEFPHFAWYLRALAFRRLGYDPDLVFADSGHDEFGFVNQRCTVLKVPSC